jgi:tyrosyl-tRNA synthetase
LSLEKIAELETLEGADINKAKIVLADEATAMLHGRDCLSQIHDTIQTMFTGGGGAASTEALPRVIVSSDDLVGDGVRLLDLFVDLELATSKKDARRLIQGGGARLEGEAITDENAGLTADDFDGKTEVTLRAGKKRAGVVELR